jgi:hypothetical protein
MEIAVATVAARLILNPYTSILIMHAPPEILSSSGSS